MTNPYNDQHFLIDNKIISLMIDTLEIEKKDLILEIGTGNGELTLEIMQKKPKEIIGIEKDKKLAEKLSKKIKQNKYPIINKDILKFKIQQRENLKIISSLPYSLSTEIFKKIIKLNFAIGVFLSGKDFFDLISNKEKKIGFIIFKLFKIKKIKDVPKNSFNPEPNVNSVLFSIRPKKIQNKLVLSLIQQDDKKIKNSLLHFYWDSGLTKNKTKEKINKLNIDEKILNKGLWQLSNKEFLKLIDILF